MIIISACLLGINCRFDGGNNSKDELKRLAARKKVMPLCPEQLGGLPTPRPPAEIQGHRDGYDVQAGRGHVVTKDDSNITAYFIKGAEEVLKLAQLYGISTAILKDGSPACGSTYIYDGTFTGRRIAGKGVTTALLRKHNITVYSEKDYPPYNERGIDKTYIGVVGGVICTEMESEQAHAVGYRLAGAEAVMVCGGRGGIMTAAARGARAAGGTVLGLLPGAEKETGNPHLSLAVATGIGEARNAIIACASDALIAISGGYGTLSEIGLALKMGKPVITLGSWKLEASDGKPLKILKASSPAEAVELALKVAIKKERE